MSCFFKNTLVYQSLDFNFVYLTLLDSLEIA